MANGRKNMRLSKRLTDIFSSLALFLILFPIISCVAILILLFDGRPVLYISERMKTTSQGFNLIKFRTMKPTANDNGVSGGDKVDRLTLTGPILRRTRLDELPQLWNIFKGDMSFIGPRPPLRQYVELYPEIYEKVLKCRPGVSGLASIYFHLHEEKLLARSRSQDETDAIYRRSCVPRKARIDLIYQRHENFCFDIVLMFKTIFRKRG